MAREDFAGLEQDLMDQGGIIAKRWGFGEPMAISSFFSSRRG